jgi:hypothetical protein
MDEVLRNATPLTGEAWRAGMDLWSAFAKGELGKFQEVRRASARLFPGSFKVLQDIGRLLPRMHAGSKKDLRLSVFDTAILQSLVEGEAISIGVITNNILDDPRFAQFAHDVPVTHRLHQWANFRANNQIVVESGGPPVGEPLGRLTYVLVECGSSLLRCKSIALDECPELQLGGISSYRGYPLWLYSGKKIILHGSVE